MATAYTSLLGLALPVTGELSGTWGDTVNNSITSLLDSAIAGTTTLSSDADVTLTTTTGASNTSRQAILLWTAGGTVTRNITAPAQSKIYTVINASSSTQSIVLRGVGPTTGVTIVKGESAVCAWNGSDFIKISNTSGAGVFTTLSVTGVATFSAGTAALPAITTTGDTNTGIFFPAADTIAFAEGGTEAVRITSAGNVGIGSLTTYEAKLKVATANGASDFSSSGINVCGATEFTAGQVLPISFTPIGNDSTRARAAIGCIVGTNWGFGNLGFYTRGAADSSLLTTADEKMRLTSDGNLGVGTSSPTCKLQVSGSAFFTGTRSNPTSGAGAEIYYDGTNASWLSYNRTTSAYIPSVFDGSKHTWNISGSASMTIDTSGNLGLGVTPSAWSSGKVLEVGNAGNSFWGNSPANVYITENAYYDGAWKYGVTAGAATYQLNQNSHIWSIAASGTAGNTITFTQAMTLDSSGALLLGGPTAFENSATRLQAFSSTVPAAEFSTAGGSTTDAVGIWNKAASGDNQFIGFYTDASPTRRGSITYNRAGGLVAYNVSSDYRAKDISGPVINSGALIDSVPVYMGTMKGATQERPMFIAHETPAYAHTGEKDAVDKDGNPVYQQMDASALIPVMWAEIQELRKRLAAANL